MNCRGVPQKICPVWEELTTIFPAHLSRANDTLQPVLLFDSDSSIPDGDGGGEDALNDGGVEVHHHCLWQVEFLQLPQEVHPLLCLLGEGADIQLQLEVLGDDGAQEFSLGL